MTAVAQVLLGGGFSVSGSEQGESPAARRLRALGIRVHSGSTMAPHVRDAGIVLYERSVSRAHPERLLAARRGIAQWLPTDWLARVMRSKIGLAVVGDRDASGASAMIGWTLVRAGLDPTVVLGTASPQLGGWGRVGHGPHFVVDAFDIGDDRESLPAQVAVVLGIPAAGPADDVWPSRRISAVRDLVEAMPDGGQVFAVEHEAWAATSRGAMEGGVRWTPLESRAGWWTADLRGERGCFRFRAFYRDRFAAEVRLQVPGRRHVRSALATLAACGQLGVPLAEIKQGLEEFTGVSRDFESRGSYRGVTLVDDEGWDAPAVGEALTVARQVFGSRRLWAVFGAAEGMIPPGAVPEYIPAFVAADHVVILDARGETSPLAQSLALAGVQARGVTGLDGALCELDQRLAPGDVVLTLGTGDVGTIADAFIRRLPRDRQSR
jgi:UDP-N-acetylmuramate--alanine ligase